MPLSSAMPSSPCAGERGPAKDRAVGSEACDFDMMRPDGLDRTLDPRARCAWRVPGGHHFVHVSGRPNPSQLRQAHQGRAAVRCGTGRLPAPGGLRPAPRRGGPHPVAGTRGDQGDVAGRQGLRLPVLPSGIRAHRHRGTLGGLGHGDSPVSLGESRPADVECFAEQRLCGARVAAS